MSVNDPPTRLSQLSAAKRALLEKRLRSRSAEAPAEQAIGPRADRGPSRLSFSQERLWFIDQLQPGTPIYNIPMPLRLAGPLQVEALRRCLNEIVRRHEALRTTFAVGPDLQPVQRVGPPFEFSLRVEDLSALPGPEREAEAVRLATEEARESFDLERGPLLRARLLRLSAEEHALLFTMHHIVSDGWSMGVLVREVARLYEAFAEGRESPLPELPVQYADFAEWQRGWLTGGVLEEQLGYWKAQLGGELPTLELPADRPRPPVPSFRGGYELFRVSKETTEGLNALSHRTGATLFMTLMAAYMLLLYRHTGQEDVLVGTPVANRNRVETEDLIGFFVNTLVLRTSLAGDPTFTELLRRVRRTALDAYAHQDLPFERLVEELHPQRDLSRNPLFQVLLALQNAPMGALELRGLTINPQEFDWDTVRLDLEFHLNELPEGLGGAMAYNADIFERETIRRLLLRFSTLLEAVVAGPERRLSELPVLAPGERRQLIDEWSRGEPLPAGANVHALFEAQAARVPEAAALVCGDRVTSYGELDRQARLVARRLRALGVGPETRVGLLLEHSERQVVALLGVLKAGGAYVPLDPATPPERVALVLRDAGAETVLTQSSLAHALPAEGLRAILLDAFEEEVVDEDDSALDGREASEVCKESAAYVIYTSGSTGRPKGVVVSHAGLAGAIRAQLAQVEGPVKGTPLQMSYAFDGSLLSIFCALTQGGVLALPAAGLHGDPAHLARLVAEGQLSHLFTVPSFYSLLLEQARPGELDSLRVVTVGAEACPPELVGRHQRQLPRARLYNEYGPTEATVYCAAYECGAGDAARASLPIGRPAAGARLYVLDDFLQPTPAGVYGQLYVGGRGVARGYLGRPALTAAVFIPDPFSTEPGARLYKTGDVARWSADGQLEFLGRADEQVKVRGFRVEPGEVESALRACEGVRDAAVVARADAEGERRLVAYVVAGDGPRAEAARLRERLRARLPEYMVPGAFVFIDELPRTPTGKVNRRALPAPEPGASAPAAGHVAPRTPTEEMLAQLWCEVLRLESVSTADNFFDLGGHSLLATRLISRVRESFSVELPLRSIFESPTVETLAERIEAARREGATAASHPIVPVERSTRRRHARGGASPSRPLVRADHGGDLPLSFAQQRLWFIHQLEPSSSAYNMPSAVRLHGALNVAALERALSEIVRRHESLRTHFALRDGGPVQLIDPPEEVRLDVLDLGQVPDGERLAEARRLAEAEAGQAFDLEHGPLYRARLLRLSEEEYVLLVTMHHIVSDGWSVGVLVKELTTLYEAFDEGRPSPLPELPIQYADFTVWQRRQLSGDAQDANRRYWKQQLGGTLPLLELPADRPRPHVQSFRGASRALSLPPELCARLKAVAQGEGVTLFMLMLAAFKVLLYRYTGQEDVVVGTPIANRNRVELEGLIGFFVNTLVLRTDLSGRPSFAELLRRVRAVALGAYAHQEMPFEQLVELLQPERSTSRSPLFQVMFSLQNAEADDSTLRGLTLQPLKVERVTTQFDLSLDVMETADGITAAAEYNTDLFDGSTVERLLGHLRAVLEGVAADPRVSVAEVPLLTDEERGQLLVAWNGAPSSTADGESLHELFEAEAAARSDAPAVVCDGARLTYGELNARANRLAHHLKELGVGPESRVCLLLERSPEVVVGLLAVLKAGGAYVPLDPRYPKARLAFMLEDARPTLILTRGQLKEELPPHGARVVCVDEDAEEIARRPAHNPAVAVAPENLAYVIYTSGSTGRPKGVCVTRASLVNHQRAVREAYGLSAGDRVLQFASLSFDVAAEEIFPTLLCGAALVLRDERVPGLGNQVEENGVTVLNLPASAWHEWLDELSRAGRRVPSSLRLVVAGSEPFARASLATWHDLGGAARLLNAYGTTETTITATLYEAAEHGEAHAAPTLPIGRPVGGVRAYVLDPLMQPVPVGVAGELHLGGACVARGYLGRPALTAAAFIPDPFASERGARLYRTGDLVRHLPDGNIEFLGRRDQQKKLRGFRVEPGEIEEALGAHASVRRALVETRPGADGRERLVAYVEAEGGRAVTKNELREYLAERLPDFMVPAAFVFVEEFPLTPGGKLDRRALPAPEGSARDEAEALVPPRSEVERVIAAIWREALGLEEVGVNDNFFDLGGHSLLLVRVHSELRRAFDADLTMLDLFKYPTIGALAGFLAPEAGAAPEASEPAERRAPQAGAEVAVVGMAGRFPGAPSVEQFWQNIRDGVESVTFFSDEELLAAGVDPTLLAHPNYVKAGVLLDDVDKFDAAFFGYNPREAEAMDPQHRLFLECAWEALERAGYDPERAGSVGVFAGAGPNAYLFNLYSHPEVVEGLGELQFAIGNEKDHLTTHVSYKLNLRGPSVAVQAACSTSLVAVHMACRSLLDGECRMALAGGVTLANYNNRAGYLYQEGGIGSPDGHCRAFDAEARGTIGGSGVGVVVLKRLSDALADGDPIHAVIKGSAVNNDGSAKVGYAAPSIEGQAEVIRAAQAAAGVRPDSLSYVEAHGTGTPLGDPIEVAALTEVFRAATDRRGFCALGSLKTNMGHLDAAAGVGGLIKTVLALEHKQLPPSLHFKQPNPALGLDDGPFYVNKDLSAWETNGGPRRAGVSSFGIGGTNAHAVLEEAPAPAPSGPSRPWQLLVLSAKTEAALEEATANLARHLREQAEANLADVAYTLQVGRKTFGHRRVVVCRDGTEAADALEALDPRRVFTSAGGAADRRVAFMFPGQGAQYVRMGEGLYRGEPLFREQVDLCCGLLKSALGFDLRDVLYPPDGGDEEAAALLKQTRVTQPALFVVEYALARLWMAWGLSPRAMIGHSIGEYVAACLAGVFSLEDALALVAARGELMQSLPEGAMLGVPLPEDEVRGLLGRGLSLAAVNGPALCTVSGTPDAIEELQARLAERGVEGRRLLTSHAFHSAMVEPIVAPFVERVRGVKLNAPRLRYMSNVTGTWVTAREATDPEYWGLHLRQTVRFADGAGELLMDGSASLLEVGPGQTLTTMVRAISREAAPFVVNSLRHPNDPCSDEEFLTRALGKLWLTGVRVEWQGFYAGQSRRRLQLPTYPFERRRYWVEWQPMDVAAGASHRTPRREPDVADWFYLPYWKPAAPPAAAEGGAAARGPWLVFEGAAGLGARITERLEQCGSEVITVVGGESFGLDEGGRYTINVGRQEDYESLLLDLKSRGRLPGAVLHSLCVGESGGRSLDESFYSLVFLAQALGRHHAGAEVSVTVLSDGAQPVKGDETLAPERAAVLGPCKVLPLEYPNLTCRSIDLALTSAGVRQEERLVEQVFNELASDTREAVVAYRDGRRWVQAFEPVRLGARPGGPALLKEEGVYLITGGLGGIGLVLARHLARTLRAKLVLTGRTALPPREEWAGRAAAEDADELGVKLGELIRMEEDGAEVLALEADAADAERMREVVRLARSRFGKVDGVIHAAGISPGGMIEAKTADAARLVLAPKVEGARVLEELFKEERLDFLALFSSLVSLTGTFGQVDYCAANAFLDAFAHYHARRYGTPTVAVNWDTWREVGMAVKADAAFRRGGVRAGAEEPGQVPDILADGISSEEGVEVFARILADEALTQVLVSTRDLQSVIRQAGELNQSRILAEVERLQREQTAHPRPEMQVAYVAPRNELEERIAGVWQSVLGIERVGVEDNFFDLGGHSLLATQLVSHLRELLRAEVPLRVVFEAPTVAGLAEYLSRAEAEPAAAPPPAIVPAARQARTLKRPRK